MKFLRCSKCFKIMICCCNCVLDICKSVVRLLLGSCYGVSVITMELLGFLGCCYAVLKVLQVFSNVAMLFL